MAQITHQGFTFTIADEVKDKYKELIDLVLATPSMTHDEKQYWFKILPIMNKEQLRTLYTILATEKKKLDDLDKKYSSELAKIEKSSNFDPEASKKQRQVLRQQEAKHEEEEQHAEEQLLEELGEL